MSQPEHHHTEPNVQFSTEDSPDPFQPTVTPENGMTMREFQAEYLCPLCHEEHTYQGYISGKADTLEELEEAGVAIIKTQEFRATQLARHSLNHHRDKDDLIQLSGPILTNPTPIEITVTNAYMTANDAYNCDACGATFQNIAQYRLHNNLDPDTAEPASPPTGTTTCPLL